MGELAEALGWRPTVSERVFAVPAAAGILRSARASVTEIRTSLVHAPRWIRRGASDRERVARGGQRPELSW